jgi:hypothetical protein
MRKRKIIIGSSIILALLVAWLSVVLSLPAKPLAVAVAFAGYTNDLNGEHVAVFTISNKSGIPIRRWDRYQIETQDQARAGPLFFRGQNVVLDSGQSEALMIPAPTNQQSWRAVFHCSSYGVRQDFADWANRSGYWRYLPQTFRGVPGQYAKSDWIEK